MAQLLVVRRMSTLTSLLRIFQKIPLSGRIALGVGIGSNGLVIVFCIPFLAVAGGSGIRPMGWAALMCMIAFWAFVVGVPSSLISFRSCGRRLSILSLLLSITPLPLSMILLHSLAAICGFELEP